MCCCIPLRRLSYLGALLHMIVGLVYLFFLGKTAIQLFQNKDKPESTPRLLFGLLYMGYFSAFLPPGVFIFWGVHKSLLKPKPQSTQSQSPQQSTRANQTSDTPAKGLTPNQLRIFIVWPSIAFLFVQVYGLTVVSLYQVPPQFADDAVAHYPYHGTALEKSKYVTGLKSSYFMTVLIPAGVTIVYLFMLFFYYREIGPDPDPIISRYAQAAQQQQQQQIAQQLQHTNLHLPSSHHHHHLHHHLPPPPQQQQQQQLTQHHNLTPLTQQGGQGHSNVYHQPNISQQQQQLSSLVGGVGGTGGSRSNIIIPPVIPPFSPMGPLTSLSYEQQQQLLKMQQQQQLLAQQQQIQQQHPQYQNQFVSMLPNPNSKNPKF